MIFIVVVRRASCEICHGQFDLKAEEKPPKNCLLCGSQDWLYGPDNIESRYIRQGVKFIKRTLDKSAASLKKQERGKRQVGTRRKGFQVKPKPDAPAERVVAK